MKKLLLTIGFAILTLSQVYAYSGYRRVQANIYFDKTQAEASVSNSFGVPIYCKGKVYGITRSGHYVYAYINKVIYPGEYASIYVYTNNFNPFLKVRDRISCRSMGY